MENKWLLNLVTLILFIGSGLMQCSRSEQYKNHLFIEFQQQIESMENPLDKQVAANELIQNCRKGNYPIFENDSTVVLLYQGNDRDIVLNGDMSYWAEFISMESVPGTDLFYKRLVFEPDARLEYGFSITKKGFSFPDPLNPYKVLNGFGPFSELAMPKYERHPLFKPFIYGKESDLNRIEKHIHESEILGYFHNVFVYVPPDYSKDKKYPALYLQDGQDYIEFSHIPVVLDGLIKSGKIQPIIAVFVQPPNRFKPNMPNRTTEYGLNDDYVRFFCDELVPFIDNNYATIQSPDNRLVAGDSYGGLISVAIGFKRPDVFGIAYGQSGYYSCFDDQLIREIDASERKNVRFWVDVGTYERVVGGNFLPKNETDFLMAARRLKKVLNRKDYDLVYKEYHEGHTWGNWRRHLIDALEYYFGNKQVL